MQTKRVLATSLIAIAFPFFGSQTLQAQETERFGLRMGMEKAEVIASVGPNSVEKDLGDVLILATTPIRTLVLLATWSWFHPKPASPK